MTNETICVLVVAALCVLALIVNHICDRIHNPAGRAKDEQLEQALAILAKIKQNGVFFPSCIEFDPYDYAIDGEEIEKEIDELLEAAKNPL